VASVGEAERPSVQHGTSGRVFVSWRLFSGLIVVSLVAALFLFFSADAFYVHGIAVSGERYLSKQEIFALTGAADLHVFWINPDEVREAVLRSPTLADVEVQVSWPPRMVQVSVQEREPALVWEQAGVATWVDLQGRVMRLWEDRPDLLRISASPLIDGPLTPELRLDEDIVSGALQLYTLAPEQDALRYHPDKGLGYFDQRGWDAWFGIGTDMPEKILIYNAIVANLRSRSIQASEINVANPDAPYYCGLISGCSGG
jgi:hypothetical protein